MARIDNLTNFLTDVADSIRSKTGKSEAIAAEDFDTEIESISGGGEAKFNIYIQETEPANKNGIWVKSSTTYDNVYLENDEILSKWNTNNIKLNSKIHETAAVSIDNYIYYFGGNSGNTTQNKAYKINIDTGTRTQLASLPYTAYGIGIAAYNGNIYLFGGRNGNTTYNYTYKYNVLSDTYTKLSDMPESIGQVGNAINNGIVYIIGGTANGGSSRKNTLFAYDIENNAWNTLAPVPQARNCPAVQVINDYIYIFGGFNGSAYSTAYKYDILNNSWSAIRNVPYTAFGIGSVKKGNFIYIFGGSTGNNSVADCYMYDTISGTYTKLNNLSVAVGRIQCSSVSILKDGYIYIIGGDTFSGTSTDNIQTNIIGLSGNFQNNSLVILGGAKQVKIFENVYLLVGLIYNYSYTNGILLLNNCYYGDGERWMLLN